MDGDPCAVHPAIFVFLWYGIVPWILAGTGQFFEPQATPLLLARGLMRSMISISKRTCVRRKSTQPGGVVAVTMTSEKWANFQKSRRSAKM